MSRLGDILNGMINPFGKVLWEGTWSSGSITVNGISKYLLLMMEQAGEPIIVVNDGSVLRGMSMAASGSIHYGRAFSSNISGNTLTLPGENNITQISHSASGNHGAMSRQSITKIVGLVPNWGGYCIAVFSRLATIFSLVRRWRHEQTIQHLECTGNSCQNRSNTTGRNKFKHTWRDVLYKGREGRNSSYRFTEFCSAEHMDNGIHLAIGVQTARVYGRTLLGQFAYKYKRLYSDNRGWDSASQCVRRSPCGESNVYNLINTISERGCVA